MNVLVPEQCAQYRLRPFRPAQASLITQWVRSPEQVRLLAPSTSVPLTADKVLAWKKPGGQAFVYISDTDPQPIGYGELNPMRRHLDHLWLGHVIIRPDQRGEGLGKKLVQALLHEAFEERLASRVLLIVFPDNTPAVQCYLGVGFTITGEEYHRFRVADPTHRLLRLEITPDRFHARLNDDQHSCRVTRLTG